MTITIIASNDGYELSYDNELNNNQAQIIILNATHDNIDELLSQVKATITNNLKPTPKATS